ncbi:hypothetical protein, conserved [Plasmodium gonderi]|uniref:U3 small nucleolar RNA-associated protein 13 C-terminal domain-containing protein n=1 Tax=Plasmodium gonderi TaxID=77519 RepID=A0A1Y1JKK1_PLAGO|nr:hypothetical protein, conserved [Plasmodium gonderi]GAW80554.1 hypothetical protein, conserved [Plasmodium gonderi]
MSMITNVEIEKKFFDFYEGDKNVFYSKEYEVFLSLCNNNVHCFKINEGSNNKSCFNIYSAKYPTCILESCVDIDDINEVYHKKYMNKHCVSLFSSIRLFYNSDKNVFLSTDDNKIHHYVLHLNDIETKGNQEHTAYQNEKNEDIHDMDEKRNDVYLYDETEEEDKNEYSYSYNWVHLKEKKIWKSQNIVITCFSYSKEGYKKLIVGYINGMINVYNLSTYKLQFSYRIHNSRITNLRMYRHFIISSDVTKNVFIYDIAKGEKVASCEDHMSGIIDFLFLAVQGGSTNQNKNEKCNEIEDAIEKCNEIEEAVEKCNEIEDAIEKCNEIEDAVEKCNEIEDVVEKCREVEDAVEKCKEVEEPLDKCNSEEGECSRDDDEKLIGFITIGNDKIMNVWDLSLLNAEDEEAFNDVKNEYNNKKKNKKRRNNSVVILSPIKQIYLTNDINHALVIPSNIFKSKKSKLIIKDENIKWLILTHDNEGNFIFYNPLNGEIIYKFKENRILINESNINKFFLLKYKLHVFREDSSLLIYDLRNFNIIKNYACKIEGIFEMLVFNPSSKDERQNDDIPSGEEELVLEDSSSFNDLNQNNFVVLTGDNIIRILNFQENLIKQTLLIGHEDVVSCIKVNEENCLLFSGSNDKNIFVWNLKNNNCIYILKDNLYTINSIDVNVKKFPKIVLVSVCEDSSLKLWNFMINVDYIKKGNEHKKKRKLDDFFSDKEIIQSNFTIYPHKVTINNVAISHNSKIVATCSKDKTIKLFETLNLKLIKMLEGHKKPVQNILFSKTDHILYSNSYDSVRLWSLTNFECLKSIQSLDFNITKILILNDNCMVNSYSNGNISLVNIKNCEKISTVNYHKDKIFCLQNCRNNSLVSASVNGELIFLKNISAKVCTDNMFEKRKNIFYENYLENLLNENKINESLLMCLKLNKKFKFKTIIEKYLNYYTFSILHLLKKFEHEYGIKRIIQSDAYNHISVSSKNDTKYHKDETNITKDGTDTTKDKSNNEENEKDGNHVNSSNAKINKTTSLDDGAILGSIHNYLDNSDILENYIYLELAKMSSNKSNDFVKCERDVSLHNGGEYTLENKKYEENHNADGNNENDYREADKDKYNDDDNFVLFLKKMKEKNENSYFLYLNKLMEFIAFFIVNHRFAYISNFLLNSVINYIDYSDICKINDYQRFFEIYNSYAPRHKNRYLQSLQKSKCFELININYYKGDIKMMG